MGSGRRRFALRSNRRNRGLAAYLTASGALAVTCGAQLACVGCVGGLTLLSCGACTYSLLACCGCAPEVRLEHMEKYVYGKELWQAYLDGEGIQVDDPVRVFCQKFFGSERFLERVGGLFDQFDADDSGKLDKCVFVTQGPSVRALCSPAHESSFR